MKKILLIILAVIFGFSFAGCAAPSVSHTFDSDKPWGKGSSSYEKCTYNIEYVERKNNDGTTVNGKVIAKGTMTYELKVTQEVSQDISVVFVDLTMSVEINYEDIDEAGDSKGLTDTITSKARFTNDMLSSVSSEKTIELAPRKNSAGTPIDTNSYRVVADYANLTATAYKGKTIELNGEPSDNYKETQQITLINDSKIYDNEQLFYTVRALKSLAAGASASFSVSNIYEISSSLDKKGRYSATAMSMSASTDLHVRKLSAGIAADYLTPDDNGEYPVNCLTVNLTKASSPSGPPITLYITDKETSFENATVNTKTNKIIVGMRQTIYDVTNRVEAYHINYTLSDYTTIEQA